MTDEERQRQMDFILSQQAQFVADIGELKDVVSRLANASLQRLETHDAEIDNLESKMAALVDAQVRSEDKISALVDAQRNLTAVVERYFSEGRNRER
ncbi:MAG: hypothetical protein ACR2LZ_00725 [Pyrinomonadaceae bacterium]